MHLLPFERGFNAAPSPPGAFRVALVAMPFGMPTARPSIQLGLLRAIATRAGFPTDTHHLYLDLAARITPRILDHLCEHMGHLLAEWLFSLAAFGEDVSADDREFFTAFPEEVDWAKRIGEDATFLSSLRHEVLPAYIEDCLNQVDWGRYQVVGFTSCFQQNVASLALARLIKERFPQVAIVFGGANWDGEMGVEYCRAFPFVDYAVVGEGDRTFPALLRSLATTGRCDQVRGVVRRDADGVQFNGRSPLVQDLDELPTPDYDEYFQRARRLGLLRPGESAEVLPFEGSRGCWWGQKHHCTFCGLNGLGMAFRTKSPQRALAELSELARRHRSCFFSATDNILDMKYVKDFFAVIHQAKADFQFFYEVKSNLTREQLRTLYLGGVRYLQPGIESLSTHVLQLMRKGCTMLQNVRLLKWCRYLQIGVGWNLLRGFPGETVEDYRRQLEVLKHLLTEYQRGTILVLEPKQFCEPIAALARTFESLLSYRFGASIWLTPKGAGPSRFHYDVENVLVMQISGSKLWRIYEAAVPFPSEHMTYSSNLTPGKLLYEVALRPGDLLYFPRGFGHEVIPSHDEHSLHVGFACLVPTAFHVIRDALHELARRDARLRQALPPGFARPGGAQRAVELVRATATALWDDLDLEGAVSQLGRRFVQHAAPLLRGAFAQASAPPAVTLDSRVRRRPHVLWRMEQQGELLCLSFHGKVLRMPREGEPALRFIVESTDFTVASLPGDLGDDEKLEFVQTLLDAGFLMPPRDASAEKLVAAVNSHGVAGRF